jgi:hypothetical protein
MGYCQNCGASTSCSCSSPGCFGKILLAIGYSIVGFLLLAIVLFVVPGLVYNFLAGRFMGPGADFLGESLDDKRTWVISAVTWICLGILWFHRQTRVPRE